MKNRLVGIRGDIGKANGVASKLWVNLETPLTEIDLSSARINGRSTMNKDTVEPYPFGHALLVCWRSSLVRCDNEREGQTDIDVS